MTQAEGQSGRCPTCGSDDPKMPWCANHIHIKKPHKIVRHECIRCNDPWHSTAEPSAPPQLTKVHVKGEPCEICDAPAASPVVESLPYFVGDEDHPITTGAHYGITRQPVASIPSAEPAPAQLGDEYRLDQSTDGLLKRIEDYRTGYSAGYADGKDGTRMRDKDAAAQFFGISGVPDITEPSAEPATMTAEQFWRQWVSTKPGEYLYRTESMWRLRFIFAEAFSAAQNAALTAKVTELQGRNDRGTEALVKSQREVAELRVVLRAVADELHEANLAIKNGNKMRNPELTIAAEQKAREALGE